MTTKRATWAPPTDEQVLRWSLDAARRAGDARRDAVLGTSAAPDAALRAEADAAAEAARVAHLEEDAANDELLGAAIQSRQDRAQQALIRNRLRQQRLQADEQRILAELDDVARDWHALEGGLLHMHQRSVAAQIAVPMRISDRTVERHMADATLLVERWPAWLDAFDHGQVSIGHLRAFVESSKHVLQGIDITGERIEAFGDDALEIARRSSVTRFRKHLHVLADRALTTPLTERHREARKERRVWVQPAEHGMATLGVHLPATLANAIEDRLLRVARTKPKDDPRTIPNVMADTAAQLLLTGSDAAGLPGFEHVHGIVHVTVPVQSLESTSVDDGADGDVDPAMLDGTQILDVETARALAAQAEVWRVLYLDPITDAPCGLKRHDPSPMQREWLGLLDVWCRFAGCAASAWRCDVDHALPYVVGGCTDLDNLEHLCRRHHMVKHHGHAEHGGTGRHAWQIEHLGHGVISWTDPAGHIYVDEPVSIGPRARRPVFTDAGAQPPPQPPPPRRGSEPPPY